MNRLIGLALFALWLVSAQTVYPACRELDVANGWTRSVYAATPDATVEFFGHNFFQITSSKGTKIITASVAPGFYPTPEGSPHAVTVGR